MTRGRSSEKYNPCIAGQDVICTQCLESYTTLHVFKQEGTVDVLSTLLFVVLYIHNSTFSVHNCVMSTEISRSCMEIIPHVVRLIAVLTTSLSNYVGVDGYSVKTLSSASS